MTRTLLAFAAAGALGVTAMPASAQDGPPPPPAAPAWGDPQAPHYPGPPPLPPEAERAGAPFAHHLPPGAYPGGPLPYPPQAGPYPGGPGPYPGAPMMWHEERGDGGGYSYWYQYSVPAACGCPGAARERIETRYRYSPPIRHVEEVVEERVVRERVVEHKTVPVRHATKYTKTAPKTKLTKSKVHSTK